MHGQFKNKRFLHMHGQIKTNDFCTHMGSLKTNDFCTHMGSLKTNDFYTHMTRLKQTVSAPAWPDSNTRFLHPHGQIKTNDFYTHMIRLNKRFLHPHDPDHGKAISRPTCCVRPRWIVFQALFQLQWHGPARVPVYANYEYLMETTCAHTHTCTA